jgi:hypothetical protein
MAKYDLSSNKEIKDLINQIERKYFLIQERTNYAFLYHHIITANDRFNIYEDYVNIITYCCELTNVYPDENPDLFLNRPKWDQYQDFKKKYENKLFENEEIAFGNYTELADAVIGLVSVIPVVGTIVSSVYAFFNALSAGSRRKAGEDLVNAIKEENELIATLFTKIVELKKPNTKPKTPETPETPNGVFNQLLTKFGITTNSNTLLIFVAIFIGYKLLTKNKKR